jgi:hypothetical protein
VSAGVARLCGRCGRVRPISKRASRDEPDICSSCWRPPTAVCTVCGDERPCSGVAAGRPICGRCRPRGTSHCAHCGATRPAAARWPEGPVCDPCYTAALRRIGTCSTCGRRRRLVAPPGPAANTCGACSGAGPTGHICIRCGAEDKLYTRGYCDRCTLVRRTDELLADSSGSVPIELAPVRDAIVTTSTPRTALNWLRKRTGSAILAALARGDIALTHEALDAHPNRRAVDYLRAVLVAHGALPPRDEPLARLERASADLLAQVPAGEDRRTLTAYATWRILHRARRRARLRPTSTAVTGHATLRLRAAIALLEWLRGNDIRLDQLRQADIDQWVLTGPATLRREIADFLGWTATRKLTPSLTLTRAAHREGPALSEEDYWRLAHRLLHDPDIATVDRVAGSFMLLYGQQLLPRRGDDTQPAARPRRDALSPIRNRRRRNPRAPRRIRTRPHRCTTPTHQHWRAARQGLVVPRPPPWQPDHPGPTRSTPCSTWN